MPPWADSAAPASSPRPVTTLIAPAGKSGLFGDAGEGERGEAGLLRRLQHRGIAHGQRCADAAPDDLHWIVPGDDMAGDAMGLAQGQHRITLLIGDGLAMELVRRPAVELEIAGERQRIGLGLA